MLEFIWVYIIGPIVAEALGEPAVWNGVEAFTGYNLFNTVLWATLAVSLVIGVQRLFEEKDIQLTPEKSVKLLPLLFLAGLLRFLQDAQDLNFYIEVMLITPIIYLWMGLLAILFLYLDSSHDITKHFYTLIGLMAGIGIYLVPQPALLPIFAVGIATALAAGVYYFLTEDTRYQETPLVFAVASQFFEGFSSIYALTEGFEPRQLLTSLFVDLFGPLGFLMIKIVILAALLKLYFDLDEEWKSIMLIAVYSVGFATGLRVLLRAATGI